MSSDQNSAAQSKSRMTQGVRSALDLGPTVIFFLTYFIAGKIFGTPADKAALSPALMWATGALLPATMISLAISYVLERKIHILPIITGLIVLIFGALTFIFHDSSFIKMKLTIIYTLFAAALMGGFLFRQYYIKLAFGTALHLSETGWRIHTWRWALFFLVLAGVNAIVWRNLPEQVWVRFKLFGVTALTVPFGVWQAMSVGRHQITPKTLDGQA